jgi:hypothetical protein
MTFDVHPTSSSIGVPHTTFLEVDGLPALQKLVIKKK